MTSTQDLPVKQIKSWVKAEHAKGRPMKEIVAELAKRDDVTLLSVDDSPEVNHQKTIDAIQEAEARNSNLLNQSVSGATASIPTPSQWLALCEQVKRIAQLGYCISNVSVENDWLQVEASSCKDQTLKQVLTNFPRRLCAECTLLNGNS